MPESAENFPKISPVPRVATDDALEPAAKISNSPGLEKFIERALADYESALIGYACTILNDIERARDVVQDTFVRLCQQDVARVEPRLKAWLFTVCRNRAFDIVRKEKRMEPLEEIKWTKVAGPGLQPDEHAELHERLARLLHYLDRLTDNQRDVIILKFQQGLSYEEIGNITGLSAGNIGFLIHTGLKRLRDVLPGDF